MVAFYFQMGHGPLKFPRYLNNRKVAEAVSRFLSLRRTSFLPLFFPNPYAEKPDAAKRRAFSVSDRVGALIARPVILEQNHIGNADIFLLRRRIRNFLEISAGGQWPPLRGLDISMGLAIIRVYQNRKRSDFSMYYRMNVAGLDRDLPICKVTDSLYIAGFVIFGDQELTVACARELLARAPEYDYIITAEAKGIPLAHEMARQAGDAKYILARKAPKLYMTDLFSSTVRSITTAKEQTLYLDGKDAKLMEGKRILVVDDVISTGESLKALEVLVEKAGGIICGRMAILAEGDAQERPDLIYLEKLPLFNPDGTVME